MTNSERVKILYVDDEENNLISFKAAFRFDYDIQLAASPQKALEILQVDSFHVILSDYRMPVMNGVELFEKIRNEYPLPVRVLITAYNDMESLIEAVNRGHIFRYIKKPWNETDLKTAVNEAFQFYSTKAMLSLQHKELVEAYCDLDKFVYSISHDLRSPITSIMSVVQLLAEVDNLEEAREYSGHISQSLVRLDNYIRSLLDYYVVKRGDLVITPIDFKKILNTIAAFYENDFKENRIKFELNVEQNEVFMSNEPTLIVAIQNLISNAVKYHRVDEENKCIKISVHINNNIAKISIEDNGIGIDNRYLDRIFEMFYRATTRSMGSGIGLFNTKNALDKLRAKMDVESTKGKGTIFKIELPGK